MFYFNLDFDVLKSKAMLIQLGYFLSPVCLIMICISKVFPSIPKYSQGTLILPLYRDRSGYTQKQERVALQERKESSLYKKWQAPDSIFLNLDSISKYFAISKNNKRSFSAKNVKERNHMSQKLKLLTIYSSSVQQIY